MEGRTTFMITHRLATLRDCDVLIEMEAGRVTRVTSNVKDAVASMTAAMAAE